MRTTAASALKGPWAYHKAVQAMDEEERSVFERDSSLLSDVALHARFDFPALIPQVWLNVLPPGNRTLAEEARLEREPQRVDFLMIAEGRRCIIEIDGPSHYADFDSAANAYEVSQERYTLNLRFQRSLQMHGFEVHRFSNLEVEETPVGTDFQDLIKHLPGMPSFWSHRWSHD